MKADPGAYNSALALEGEPASLRSAEDGSSQGPESASKMTANAKRSKIALFGMFGVGNLGNECTLRAMLLNIRRYLPNAQVCCICGGPEETALTYQLPVFPIGNLSLPPLNNRILRLLRRLFVVSFMELSRWVKAIKTMAGTDMLVMTGTGMLSDLGIGPFDLHYDILRWSIAAKLCRCKVLFVSVGVGPIRHPLSRVFVKAALTLADYKSYRDVFSKTYAERLGIKGDVYPDLVFSLPAAFPKVSSRDRQKTIVGIGLITHETSRSTREKVDSIYQNYIANIATFVRWLIEHDYTVRLLIGDVAYDGRVRQDLRALLERSGLKYERGQIIDEPVHSVDELLAQLAGTDIVVASRFHNLLLSLVLRKPVVAISFHEKVDSLMSAMGMTQFCQDIENVEVDKLIGQLDAIEKGAESIKVALDEKMEVYRSSLEEQYERIFKLC